MDIADRRRICQLVAGVLVADGHVGDDEILFLTRVYARFGLPTDEVGYVEPTDAGAASEALRQLPEQFQAQVVALLVEAAISDGTVDAQERAFLLVAAAALGIEADEMERRIASRLERFDRQGPMSDPSPRRPV